MSVKFVIDSASDILPADARMLDVICLPLKVIFGGQVYEDGAELTHEAFYEKLAQNRELPTTSQATPAEFAGCFEELVSQGHSVVAVTLSSELSGTYQSACIAAEEFPEKVFVVDSLNATVGERILLERGVELARQGMEAKDVAAALDAEKKDIRLMAVVDTLEYLKKGGRISAAAAVAGTLLSVKPLVQVEDGQVVVAGKARGHKQAFKMLRQLVEDTRGIDPERPCSLVYSGTDDTHVKSFLSDNSDLLPANIPVRTLGCAIGTHIGPGGYGVAYFEK